MRDAVDQNVAAIDEGLAILGRLDGLSENQPAARVGPHFRHCIDFYDCFLRGLAEGRIDYDARRRSADVEANPGAAVKELERIRQALRALATDHLTRPVEVLADTLPSQEAPSRSTVNRELAFLLSHTIHHYALIALLLRQDGITVPDDFGFAPSTLEHAAHES